MAMILLAIVLRDSIVCGTTVFQRYGQHLLRNLVSFILQEAPLKVVGW